MPDTDFIFGLTGNANLLRSAEPAMQQARALYAQRQSLGEDTSVRLYEAFHYGAGLAQAVPRCPQGGGDGAGGQSETALSKAM